MAAVLSPEEPQTSSDPWRGFAGGMVAEPRRRSRLHPEELHALRRRRELPGRSHRAHEETMGEAVAAARRGAGEGRARRLPGALRNPRPRARLHRQGVRDHRRPADRCAAQAGDHAARRLARGRSEPQAYGFEPDPKVAEIFTKYRKTHNDGVFDAYTPDIKKCRSSHIITGLPDNYGRGRIIGDYRRVALYGVDFLIKDKERDKAELDDRHSTEEVIRLREELAEQIRALKELKQMGKNYGFDIWRRRPTPAKRRSGSTSAISPGSSSRTARRCRWAALSTFLDIYFERDLREGTLTESQAQEIIDDFVIKLRLVRFLRAPEYNQLFSGDPVWATDVVGGMGDDGRTLVTKSNFRMLNTLYTLGPAPEPNITIFWSTRLPAAFKRFAAKVSDRHQRRSSTRATTSCGRSRATTAPSPAACRRCGSASRCSSSAPA